MSVTVVNRDANYYLEGLDVEVVMVVVFLVEVSPEQLCGHEDLCAVVKSLLVPSVSGKRNRRCTKSETCRL